MASSKALIASLLLISLLVLYLAPETEAGYQSPTIDCGVACSARCGLSSRPNLCKRACGTCCGRCNCVPPGTSGNLDACPCYASLTTRGGKPKCP